MINKETFFTPEFKADALDRIANWQSRQHEKPAWLGLFWPGTGTDINSDTEPFRHHDGRSVIRFEIALRKKDFDAAIFRYPKAETAIQDLKTALAGAGLKFAEDDIQSLCDDDGNINRYRFHSEMLKLIAKPDDKTLQRIAFVSERLQLFAKACVENLLFKTTNGVFQVLTDASGSYTLSSLGYQQFAGGPRNFSGRGTSLSSTSRQNDEVSMFRASRELALVPERIDVFTDRRFVKFMTGPVLQTRQSSSMTRLAVILTDMAAQGVTAAQLIDRKGVSHTLVDLEELTTLKKARARLHESFGWPRYDAIRELPDPQVVHRFIIIDRKIVADTPLLTDAEPGTMSEVTYCRENGVTCSTVRSVPAHDISQSVIALVNNVIAALPQKQLSALIDIGLSESGPSLVDVHDIFDKEWFTADHSAIIAKLSEVQKKPLDEPSIRRRPRMSNIMETLVVLENIDPEEIP